MNDINLGALTTSVQRGGLTNNDREKEELTSSKSIKEDDPQTYSLCRVQLTEENKKRIDLMRISDEIEFVSRTQIVNQIIAQYFEANSESISSNIKNVLDRLQQ